MVLVVEHVAVHHEQPGVVGEGCGDVDGLARVEPPGVLEAELPRGWGLPVAADGAPLLLVQVDVVGHVAGVAQPPPLGGSLANPVVHARRVEHLAVDRPVGAVMVLGQVERPRLGDLAWHLELRHGT